jgi:ABC-2 type transport system permease protein
MTAQFMALVRKDLRLFFSDRRAVIMSVVAPIAIASFMGYLFGGSGVTETSRIPVLAADLDGSAISREVVASLAGEKALDVKPASVEQGRQSVRRGKATVAIVIPKGFGTEAGRAFFSSEKKPEIGLLFDPSHSAELSMVQGVLSGAVMQAVSKEMFQGPMGRQTIAEALPQIDSASDMTPDEKKTLRGMLENIDRWNAARDSRQQTDAQTPAQGLRIPFDVRNEAVTSSTHVPYNGYAHSFAGMAVQFILFVGIDVGLGLLVLRQQGVWKRLRAAPLSRGTLLGSRAVSAAVTSMLVLMAVFGFARVVFGVRVAGSMAGFLGVCAAFSLMTASFGLLIAALGKTPEATRGLATMATLMLVMLGGAWVPAFMFPRWLQTITMAIPTRWAVDGLDAATWRGLGFASEAGPIAALLGAALLCGALAVARFRWEEK